MLAGTLVEPWTQTGPRDQVARRCEPGHVESDLTGQHTRGRGVHTGNRRQVVDVFLKRREDLAHALLQIAHALLQLIHLGEVELEKKSMVCGHSTTQRLDQFLPTRFESTA